MTFVSAVPRPPGRPRSSRADAAILDAVLDLLAENGTVETLSIEAIAARAGVGKATIYRRWASKDACLRDALLKLKGEPPQPLGRSVREDLLLLLGAVGQNIDPRAERIMPCLAPRVNRSPEHYQLYQSILEPRRQLMREVLRRGVRSGELRPDLDIEVAMTVLVGPVLAQRMLHWHPGLDQHTLAEQVVDLVLAGLTAR